MHENWTAQFIQLRHKVRHLCVHFLAGKIIHDAYLLIEHLEHVLIQHFIQCLKQLKGALYSVTDVVLLQIVLLEQLREQLVLILDCLLALRVLDVEENTRHII